jgi:hypothetical protein
MAAAIESQAKRLSEGVCITNQRQKTETKPEIKKEASWVSPLA